MKLLTIREVAVLLKLNKFTTYRYVKKGIIPAFRIGRNWRVLEDLLNDWVKELSDKAPRAYQRRKKLKKKKKSKRT